MFQERPVERIDEIIEELRVYWKDNPDLRLAQIISNLAQEKGFEDPFYFEDYDLLNVLINKNDG